MPASTRPASFEWASGTVLQKNNNRANLVPNMTSFAVTSVPRTFSLLPRVRAHVAGVKGFDVKA
eukprot:1424397-Pyramimonas_sp.AAC.1